MEIDEIDIMEAVNKLLFPFNKMVRNAKIFRNEELLSKDTDEWI